MLSSENIINMWRFDLIQFNSIQLRVIDPLNMKLTLWNADLDLFLYLELGSVCFGNTLS